MEKQDEIQFGTLKQFGKIIRPAVVKKFDCGDDFLNSFAQKIKKLDESNAIRAIVAVKGNHLCGYITMKVGNLAKDSFQDKSFGSMPLEVPVMMIDQIATSLPEQGKGIGRTLLSQAFRSALIIKENAGLKGVALWSHPNAVSFYQKLGLIPLTTKVSNSVKLTLMFIAIETIEDALSVQQAIA
ncbi:GNAT family N-acetyltransferase [Shewanella colwelliana]|uniref:GNAT family N-acetyltransferase n=1 Tax=Shewanella colwelliana TaxID=23 RepID=UPI0022AED6C0|nr:GNAT family N-acetyltransferase [Shewanella colwelliana]MCZ4337660.1 GNAT family N-acetyltransferase [Shewanella colwelliana]